MFGPFSKHPSHVFEGELVNGKSEEEGEEMEHKKPGKTPGSHGRRMQKKLSKLRQKRDRDESGSDVDSDEDPFSAGSFKQMKKSAAEQTVELKYQNEMQAYTMKRQNLQIQFDLAMDGSEKEAARAAFLTFCKDSSLMPTREQ